MWPAWPPPAFPPSLCSRSFLKSDISERFCCSSPPVGNDRLAWVSPLTAARGFCTASLPSVFPLLEDDRVVSVGVVEVEELEVLLEFGGFIQVTDFAGLNPRADRESDSSILPLLCELVITVELRS